MDVGSSPVEALGVSLKKIASLLAVFALSLSCASKAPQNVNVEALKKNNEFEERVKIVEVAPSVSTVSGPVTVLPSDPPPAPAVAKTAPVPSKAVKRKTPLKNSKTLPAAPLAPTVRLPEIESNVGFAGRRPLRDPFRVGETVVHSVNYFKMSAGTLTLQTRPFAEVNGRKNYQFRTSIKTSSLFSSFYSVDDYVDVLMDFEELVPSVFTLHVKETSQVKEAQMLFDHATKQATYWERKVTKKGEVENKKQQWEIPPYAQNVFSAAFYMRVFQWEVGKENAFYVSDDEKNLIFRGKALRKERLSTAIGDFDSIVIRPEFELQGKFNPTGENYIWLSDDDRKYVLRIESKIKIGTLVSEIIQLNPGQP